MKRDLTPKKRDKWQYQIEDRATWEPCSAQMATRFVANHEPDPGEEFDPVRLGDGVPEVVDEEEHQP
jgi:hypothetical protein